jgi:hypothetical protein
MLGPKTIKRLIIFFKFCCLNTQKGFWNKSA